LAVLEEQSKNGSAGHFSMMRMAFSMIDEVWLFVINKFKLAFVGGDGVGVESCHVLE
jgi:hypothetical protein